MGKMLSGIVCILMPARFEADPQIEGLLREAAVIAGGFTLDSARGGYVREDTGQLQVEPITAVTVHHATHVTPSMSVWRKRFVDRLFQLGEESVFVSYTRELGHGFKGLIFNERERVAAPPPIHTSNFAAVHTTH